MQPDALLIFLIIGAVAGFLAGLIVKGYGFGDAFRAATELKGRDVMSKLSLSVARIQRRPLAFRPAPG